LLGSRDARFQIPALFEGDIVEEAKGGRGDNDQNSVPASADSSNIADSHVFLPKPTAPAMCENGGKQGDV
jgi:hypothetical protein